MAETQVTSGYGSLVELETANGSGVYTALDELLDITPPSSSPTLFDASHMSSPGGNMEYGTGLVDPGEVQFTMNYVAGSVSDLALIAWAAARDRRKMRVTLPNKRRSTFTTLLTGYTPAIPLNDRMTAQVAAKVSGAVTYDVAP